MENSKPRVLEMVPCAVTKQSMAGSSSHTSSFSNLAQFNVAIELRHEAHAVLLVTHLVVFCDSVRVLGRQGLMWAGVVGRGAGSCLCVFLLITTLCSTPRKPQNCCFVRAGILVLTDVLCQFCNVTRTRTLNGLSNEHLEVAGGGRRPVCQRRKPSHGSRWPICWDTWS